MKRIIVTGATSMIGTALIEECIRHDIEVYAVVRAGSSKTKRLPESARIHQIECELEKLEELPAKITGECDTFFHIAWGNTGENRNSSTELQSRNVFYTLRLSVLLMQWDAKDLSEQVHRQNMDRWMFRGSHRTVRYIRRRLTVRASSLQTSFLSCFVRNLEWNGSGREFSVCMEYMKKRRQ